MIKVTTEHGTYYLIDNDKGIAKRVASDNSNPMRDDGQWFAFYYVTAYDRKTMKDVEGGIQIGYSIYFLLTGLREYDWKISTPVVSIENYDPPTLPPSQGVPEKQWF